MTSLFPKIFVSMFWMFLLLGPVPAVARDQSARCDDAAQIVAEETDVPYSVLQALTRTETGRLHEGKVEPWAWTVNMEGTGQWFETQTEARAFVLQHFLRGARSFDVGCFQLNYKWHGDAFSSIEEMFDPLENARYAANFLKSLHAETGDWLQAVGHYHSRTEQYAAIYRNRFSQIFADLESDAAETQVVELNEFPLLVRPARLGSLVALPNVGAQVMFRAAAPLSGG
jgi:hypothetical protein